MSSAEISPFLFLPSPDVFRKPQLTGSADVLGHHGLSHLYDTHVRAYLPPQPNVGSPAPEPKNLKLVFRTDFLGRVASVGKGGEPREMDPTYREYLPDITFPPDFSPSTNLEYLAFHPNPNLPETIAPADETFLQAFRLAPGKIAPEEFDGSVLGVLPPDGGVPKPERKPPPTTAAPSQAPQVATQTLKIKVTARLAGATPGTPSYSARSPQGAAKPAGAAAAPANVGPGYPGTPTGTTIRLSVGKKK